MKHLELHIIQSVPVTCLNRDDLGSPKTAIFGGVQRARVSSQSWKRAIRQYAKEILPQFFKGERTKYLHKSLLDEFLRNNISEKDAKEGAQKIVETLAGIDKKRSTKISEKSDQFDEIVSSVLYFLSPLEVQTIVKNYIETKDVKKSIKAIGTLKDAADISLFGRMVANDSSLNIEASAMFSHALSVHKTGNEIDFFSAVDDSKPEDSSDSGSSHIDTLEFNSATYYRFAALNLDMLADNAHLSGLTQDERKDIVQAFIKATIMAVPNARKNSMNGNTLPSYVLGIVRESGHPIQLVNAFEKAICSQKGYVQPAIEELEKQLNLSKEKWGITNKVELSLPKENFASFITTLAAEVV